MLCYIIALCLLFFLLKFLLKLLQIIGTNLVSKVQYIRYNKAKFFNLTIVF